MDEQYKPSGFYKSSEEKFKDFIIGFSFGIGIYGISIAISLILSGSTLNAGIVIATIFSIASIFLALKYFRNKRVYVSIGLILFLFVPFILFGSCLFGQVSM